MNRCQVPARKPVPGEFVAPEDEQTQIELESSMRGDLFAKVIEGMKGDKSATGALKVASDTFTTSDSAGRDMITVISHNSCSSPALDRLRNNMRLYASGRESLSLTSDTTPLTPDSAAAEADFKRGESLLGSSTIDTRTNKIVPAPGCIRPKRRSTWLVWGRKSIESLIGE